MSPKHEQYDVGVKALIVRNGRLLMVRRADHGVWEVPGGRVDYDGDILSTLQREISEELPGAKATKVGNIVHAEQSLFRLPHGNRLMLLFFPVEVRLARNQKISSEHSDMIWARAADLEDLDLHTTVKTIAIAILARAAAD